MRLVVISNHVGDLSRGNGRITQERIWIQSNGHALANAAQDTLMCAIHLGLVIDKLTVLDLLLRVAGYKDVFVGGLAGAFGGANGDFVGHRHSPRPAGNTEARQARLRRRIARVGACAGKRSASSEISCWMSAGMSGLELNPRSRER